MFIKVTEGITIGELVGMLGALTTGIYAFVFMQANIDAVERAAEANATRIDEKYEMLSEAIKNVEAHTKDDLETMSLYQIELKHDLQESDRQLHEKMDVLTEHIMRLNQHQTN